MRLSEAITKYLAACHARNLRPRTLVSYSIILRHFVGYARHVNITSVEGITPEGIQAYLNWRLKRGMHPNSLNTELVVVCGMLSWHGRQGHIPPRRWSKLVPKLKVDRPDPRWLTPDECSKMLAAAESIVFKREKLGRRRDLAMLALFLDTGLRVSELCGLRLMDVDLSGREIRVSESAKSRRPRIVWFSEKTASLLRSYLQLHPNASAPEHAFFVGRHGRGLSSVRVWSIIVELARAVGLEGVCVHSLRHTNCTELIKSDIPLPVVQKLLGHANIETTMKYLHLVTDDIRKRVQGHLPMDKLK